MQLKLTKVIRQTKDKNGNELMTKDGRPYVRLAVQCVEYGQKWISGFAAPWNQEWFEGKTVEAEVVQKGDYLNINKPDPMSNVTKAIMNLTVRVTKLEERMSKVESPSVNTLVQGVPSMPEPDEIPVIGEEDLPDMPF